MGGGIVSRDLTSAEWAEEILRPRELELVDLKRRISYVRRRAYYEGLTAHLRPGNADGAAHSCPFCSEEWPDLHDHLIICQEVPDELREPLPPV